MSPFRHNTVLRTPEKLRVKPFEAQRGENLSLHVLCNFHTVLTKEINSHRKKITARRPSECLKCAVTNDKKGSKVALKRAIFADLGLYVLGLQPRHSDVVTKYIMLLLIRISSKVLSFL